MIETPFNHRELLLNDIAIVKANPQLYSAETIPSDKGILDQEPLQGALQFFTSSPVYEVVTQALHEKRQTDAAFLPRIAEGCVDEDGNLSLVDLYKIVMLYPVFNMSNSTSPLQRYRKSIIPLRVQDSNPFYVLRKEDNTMKVRLAQFADAFIDVISTAGDQHPPLKTWPLYLRYFFTNYRGSRRINLKENGERVKVEHHLREVQMPYASFSSWLIKMALEQDPYKDLDTILEELGYATQLTPRRGDTGKQRYRWLQLGNLDFLKED